MSTFKPLRLFAFTVTCSMGKTKYVVIDRSSEIAISELNQFFSHDPKFKVLAVDKLSQYNYQVETK